MVEVEAKNLIDRIAREYAQMTIRAIAAETLADELQAKICDLQQENNVTQAASR